MSPDDAVHGDLTPRYAEPAKTPGVRPAPKGGDVRIVVDRGKCRGFGLCEVEAVDLFEVQRNGSLRILNATPDEGRHDAAEAAMVACPTGALSGVED